jgi:hypothetical protein
MRGQQDATRRVSPRWRASEFSATGCLLRTRRTRSGRRRTRAWSSSRADTRRTGARAIASGESERPPFRAREAFGSTFPNWRAGSKAGRCCLAPRASSRCTPLPVGTPASGPANVTSPGPAVELLVLVPSLTDFGAVDPSASHVFCCLPLLGSRLAQPGRRVALGRAARRVSPVSERHVDLTGKDVSRGEDRAGEAAHRMHLVGEDASLNSRVVVHDLTDLLKFGGEDP